VLADKIRGGWAGQMIGVAYGAPTEFKSNGKIIEANIGNYQNWTPDRIKNAIVQDDLYVEMTFADVMDRLGLDATTEQYGEMFKDSQYNLWHANAAARRLLNQGIKAPLSGDPRYNIHANDIDFQIEADFIGLMTPGLPRESNKYCERVGRVMNYGDGLYGGMFVTGMYAAAFFEKDSRRVVEAGLATIPPASGYAKIVRDTLDWSAKEPDWKKTWQLIQDKWDKDDPCSDGALNPFNIDARLNGAYIALGLLYGGGDFTKTLDITTRAGQDSDCNPSSAAGVLGVMLGYENIPAEWKAGLDQIADQKFDYTNYSFNSITESTLVRALKVIQGAGGKVVGDEITIPDQTPQPAKLEQWDMGIPDKLVGVKDSAWQWKGAWSEEMNREKTQVAAMRAEGAGDNSPAAEATLSFAGTAVALIGNFSQDGGRADVYLDGKKAGEINAFVVPRTHDNDLWHTYNLRPGAHTVRVVVRSDADPRSKGKTLRLSRAIVFRAA
ncbi:MAG TPA: ADP-ribosylglycohydrolase family protein, partial [Pyrinomonadaceae bacterium]|nr:ADP-ribosylglycohydrolase family protein [Pyrinomonadaceae bacterium]